MPVPERAKAPLIPEKGYLLDHFGGGMYGVRNASFQSAFLVTSRGVVVIDAPPSLGEKLLHAIAEVTSRPVTHVVYSHAHSDHIGAANLFPGKVQYVAHELTGDLLRRAGDPRRPLPTRTFPGAHHVLNVGGQRLVLDYHGNNHVAGNLFVHAPEHRVLVLVDVLIPRWAPFFRLALSPNVPNYLDTVDVLRRYEFTTLVTGHFGHYGDRESVDEHAEFLRDLRSASAEALRVTDFAEAVRGVDPANTQAQIKVYTGTMVGRTVELMGDKWLSRIGGADVFLPDHASAMLTSLMID
ncbi:MBL fold metallo-hydrolase [Allokutzneria multivorans]|uniref:MBL fold metallo-hydrolase n=1 Tax=Allokutzneria multivorans TaxID=1142134 RepID=A0ABP7TBA2_9PSEU